MKKRNLLFGMLAFVAFGFTSCSDDDNSDSVNNDTIIAGTYNLTEANTQAPTDFNQDNTPHTNQVLESSCYTNNKIILNADNTFTFVDSSILIDQTTGLAACASNTVTGTWERTGSGSQVLINATYTQNGSNTTIRFTKDADELTYVKSGLTATYPDRDSQGNAQYTLGSTEYVFVKQ